LRVFGRYFLVVSGKKEKDGRGSLGTRSRQSAKKVVERQPGGAEFSTERDAERRRNEK